MFDIAIIGAGAAGYMAAITAKRESPDSTVVIIEKSSKVLAKVRISGGGRCNVTHKCHSIAELSKAYPRGGKFLKNCFNQWNVQNTLDFFADLGVETYAQPDGRMFPKSNDSETIAMALENMATSLGIKLILSEAIKGLEREDDLWLLQTRDESFKCKTVILATGGFPRLREYNFLAKHGIEITAPAPSLFSFNVNDHALRELTGLSVPSAMVKIDGEKEWHEGAALVTHWGISGPAVLRSSSMHAFALSDKKYNFTFRINWLGISESSFDIKWALKLVDEKAKKMKNVGFDVIPQRLWEYLLKKSGINPDTPLVEFSKALKNKLKENLLQMPVQAEGKTTFKEEFVTAGGIALSNMNKNMGFKNLPNLYACGEILDIDGITGGYNFQAAWSTGYLAGKSAAGI